MPPVKENESIIEFRMEKLEEKIETLEDKIDQILAKINGLNCPVHNLKLDTIEKRVEKIENQPVSKPSIDTKFISEVTSIIVKAVIAIVTVIFGFKQM